MNKQQIIEMTVDALSKGDYAIIRGEKVERLKELLKKLLEDKTDIVNFVPQDSEDIELEIPQNPVGYSYDRFIISEEQSDEQKICEMIECALGLSTVKAYRRNENTIEIRSGFQRSLFNIKGNKAFCIENKHLKVNDIAKKVYSQFYFKSITKDISLDDYIDSNQTIYSNDLTDIFVKSSKCIGNEILFGAFRTGNMEKLDSIFSTKKSSFDEFSLVFENGMDFEYIRKVLR